MTNEEVEKQLQQAKNELAAEEYREEVDRQEWHRNPNEEIKLQLVAV